MTGGFYVHQKFNNSLSNLFFYLSVEFRITQKSTINEFINQVKKYHKGDIEIIKKILAVYLLGNYFAPLFSDKSFIKLKSKLIFGKSFDLDNPITFNEKMNWLKLNDRNPSYSNLVDKLKVNKKKIIFIQKEKHCKISIFCFNLF